VLFVSHTGDVSGAEFVLLDIARDWRDASAFVFEAGTLSERLAALGLSVTIAKNGAGLSQFRRDKSPVAALTQIGKFGGLIRELARAARRHDVVYANSQKAFTLAAVAMLIARRPLVWHLHDILDGRHFGATQRRMQIFLANRFASAVIVPSEAAAAAFRAAGGKASLVHVVPNGRDVAVDPRDKAQLREDLHLPKGALVGVFSRLAPWKGQEVVIRALANTPDVACVLVGEALFGEDAYAAKLRALVTDLGLSDRVIFLGRRSDVSVIMQAMDLMVHPSIEAEPFGLTLVEAMFVGAPVVASDAGASREILDDGRCGALVPAGDPVALADAILATLANPADNAVKAAAAQQRAGSLYTVARMQAAIAGLIDTHARRVQPCS
jgi:glycosyltransferase involved in cell wall biosynthesis